MNLNEFIDLLVIIVIVTLVINIVSKFYGRIFNNREHMDSSSSSNNESTAISFPATITEPAVHIPSPLNSQNISKQESGEVGVSGARGCTVCDNDVQVDDYLRRNLLSHANICDKDKINKDTDRDTLEKYRNDFFGFKNSVNQTSNTDDMVDRVNDLYLSGNADISRNHKGVAIKDLFDGLTKGPDIYNGNCVRAADLDSITQEPAYKSNGFRGEAYTRDNWVYGEEKVTNGGSFYENIYGRDPEAGDNQAVNN